VESYESFYRIAKAPPSRFVRHKRSRTTERLRNNWEKIPRGRKPARDDKREAFVGTTEVAPFPKTFPDGMDNEYGCGERTAGCNLAVEASKAQFLHLCKLANGIRLKLSALSQPDKSRDHRLVLRHVPNVCRSLTAEHASQAHGGGACLPGWRNSAWIGPAGQSQTALFQEEMMAGATISKASHLIRKCM
jgi:hypothetical protein